MKFKIPTSILNRDPEFWGRVDVRARGMCWLWLGGTKGRYGGWRGKYAHRYAWTLVNGRESKYNVLHRCDVTLCVNAFDHLWEGSPADNTLDCIEKGRFGVAKLTELDVRDIRLRYRAGETQAAIAGLYGLHVATVLRIIRHISWVHTDFDLMLSESQLSSLARATRLRRTAHLTEKDVQRMRRLYGQGARTYAEVAKIFGLSESATWQAINRKTWTHVP